jgi:hypothetical protein
VPVSIALFCCVSRLWIHGVQDRIDKKPIEIANAAPPGSTIDEQDLQYAASALLREEENLSDQVVLDPNSGEVLTRLHPK